MRMQSSLLNLTGLSPTFNMALRSPRYPFSKDVFVALPDNPDAMVDANVQYSLSHISKEMVRSRVSAAFAAVKDFVELEAFK